VIRLGDAARLRLGALALVAVLVIGLRALAPDPGARRASLLLVALGLGYGHQLAALRFGSRRRKTLDRLLVGVTTLSAALAFAAALASGAAAWLLVALAWLAAWHVLENDVAGGRARGSGRRLPPLSRRPGPHLVTLAASAAVVGLALWAPGSAPAWVGVGVPAWLAVWTPEEVIALLLLYHSAAWLGRALGRASRASRRAPILVVHALPLLALAAANAFAPAVFAWAASPPAYLFLSAAHAVHTCFERGFEAA
jgi:hypothetical protein